MRVQHVAQAATNWPDTTETNRQAGACLTETIERIRWRLWHGQVKRALDLIAETVVTVDVAADDKSPIAAVARKVARLLGDLETYVSGQSNIIIDYATARRREEPISTAITESTVQWLLHRRMNAQQQMRWCQCRFNLAPNVVRESSLPHMSAIEPGTRVGIYLPIGEARQAAPNCRMSGFADPRDRYLSRNS